VIVINGNRTTAIVIRHRGDSVTLVPMKSGRLSAKTVAFDEFRRDWKETGYALSQGMTTFLAHIMKWGASLEVVKGLEKLAARDRFVVASLFLVSPLILWPAVGRPGSTARRLPNPGKMGLGIVLVAPDGLRTEQSVLAGGTGCNNEAELRALRAALDLAFTAGARALLLRGDSDVALRYVRGPDSTGIARLQVLIALAHASAWPFRRCATALGSAPPQP
jgi:hypothetical protein